MRTADGTHRNQLEKPGMLPMKCMFADLAMALCKATLIIYIYIYVIYIYTYVIYIYIETFGVLDELRIVVIFIYIYICQLCHEPRIIGGMHRSYVWFRVSPRTLTFKVPELAHRRDTMFYLDFPMVFQVNYTGTLYRSLTPWSLFSLVINPMVPI